MKISLDELRTLPQPRLELSFKETLEGTEAVKPVVGELSVSASATGMKLTGSVQTLLKLQCDRCLRPYFQSLTVDIDESFVLPDLNSGPMPKERELSAKDFIEELSDDGVLDISDVVYQAVTLATPTACLCGDQCPGPQMPDGASKKGSLKRGKEAVSRQEQIDPRWKNLKSLFPKEDADTKS